MNLMRTACLTWYCGALSAFLAGAAGAQQAGVPPSSGHTGHPARAGWASPLLASELDKYGAIYVSVAGDPGTINIYSKSKSHQLLGQISAPGVCDPTGLAFDADGNLYAASWASACDGNWPAVTVFSPGQFYPRLTITAGMTYPVSIAIRPNDQAVFVTDESGKILAYPAGKTDLKKTIEIPHTIFIGDAFNSANSLYASYLNDHTGVWHIGKYDAGNSRFKNQGIKVKLGGGITFDRAGRLVVVDQRRTTISVYKSGSTKPDLVFHGFVGPFTAAFDPDGKHLYVDDYSNREIDELSYPDGKRLGKIGGFEVNTFGLAVSAPLNQRARHEDR